MSRKIGMVAGVVAWLLVAGVPGALAASLPGQSQTFELTADSVEYEQRRSLYIARGNVRISSKDTELTADWMVFNHEISRGAATGNIVFSTSDDVLRARFIEFNIDTQRGILFGAAFDSEKDQFRLQGEEIVKHSDDTYSFERGRFTTCECPDPDDRDPWAIKAESAQIDVGGYGTARNSTFEILGVPVVWLPWMTYPLKTERESGLLFPVFGFSGRNGAELGLPVFWAAHESVNVIATPGWMSKRGPTADLAVEYLFGERSKGEISGHFVYDQSIDPDSKEDPFGRERWAIQGEKDFFLPWDLRFKSDFAAISDNEYLSDFNDLPQKDDDRFLVSTAFLGRSFAADGRFGALTALVFSNDLQNPNDQDRDRFLLQRLPTVAAVVLPAVVADSIPILDRIVPSLGLEYSFFTPRRRAVDKYDGLDAAYYANAAFIDTGIDALPSSSERGFPGDPDPHGDDATTSSGGLELNGRFEEGEPLADDGHRIDIHPRLAVPFRISDYVEVYPEVGWHQTFYESHFMGSNQRHLLTTQVDLRSRLRRHYSSGLTHLIEPHLSYGYISDLGSNQDDNPLFVPNTAVPQERIRQLELGNVMLDDADRVRKFNGFTYGVSNRFYTRVEGEGAQLIADVYLSNGVDVEEGEFGPIYLGATAYPLDRTSILANFGFDPEGVAVSEATAQIAFLHDRGHEFALRYRYLRKTPKFFEDFENSSERFDNFESRVERINQISAYARIAITHQWWIHYRGAYTFEDGLMLKNIGGIEYVSDCRCWAAGFQLGHSRSKGIRFNLTYTFLGLGDDLKKTGPTSFGTGDISLLDSL
ncbi:MAG: LPS-assembly protein LptD [Deltaproteobacteria bacterium]|nr:LPS-assembly protein LptD [Deltaproteobacteria bacterium]MBW2398019.1 LPS-assembly protein LptD [Deltaproteobacteria bacterium]